MHTKKKWNKIKSAPKHTHTRSQDMKSFCSLNSNKIRSSKLKKKHKAQKASQQTTKTASNTHNEAMTAIKIKKPAKTRW